LPQVIVGSPHVQLYLIRIGVIAFDCLPISFIDTILTVTLVLFSAEKVTLGINFLLKVVPKLVATDLKFHIIVLVAHSEGSRVVSINGSEVYSSR